MKTEPLQIKYPSELERAVYLTKAEMEQQICLMAALKMFELGKLSFGKAAELAGLSRPDFVEACGRYRVSMFNYPAEEVEAEIKRDLEMLRKVSTHENHF